MKDNMELTLREICNYVACMNSLVEHKIVSFNPDNAYLEFCEEGAIKFLEEQNLKQKVEIERLHSIIKEVREYIENNSLYEQDYDYDYEENLVEYPPSDERARKDILEILDKES